MENIKHIVNVSSRELTFSESRLLGKLLGGAVDDRFDPYTNINDFCNNSADFMRIYFEENEFTYIAFVFRDESLAMACDMLFGIKGIKAKIIVPKTLSRNYETVPLGEDLERAEEDPWIVSEYADINTIIEESTPNDPEWYSNH